MMMRSAICTTELVQSWPHSTGKERDTESGNDYFGARYYASSMGRFLSPDWSAKVMPVPYAKLDNPQSLNLYVYVLNNPMTGIDKDGHCTAGGFWCDTWNKVKSDVAQLNKSTRVMFEAGFGIKESVKVGAFEAHAGGSIHDEKSYGAADKKLTDGPPIKDKAEVDIGVKLVKAEGSVEAGVEHSSDTGTHGYIDPKATLSSEGGGEASTDGGRLSLGVASYDIIGGGVTVSFDQKPFVSLMEDISSAVEHLTTQTTSQQP